MSTQRSSEVHEANETMPPLQNIERNRNRVLLQYDRDESQELDSVSDMTQLTQYTNAGSLELSLLREDEVTMNEEQKKDLLIRSYAILTPKVFQQESLNTIRLIVNRDIVSSVKFIRQEHVDGKSKLMKDKTKQFPSFWHPDLRQKKSMYNDILNSVGNLNNASLQYKVKYWMGIRDKVLETIRSHRSNTLTKIKKDIVEGEC
jgi:hypothetical protein